MSDVQPADEAGPPVSDKIHFWLGGRLPITLGAWVQEQIQSRWFPLRRMVAVVPAVVIVTIANLGRDKSLSYVLLFAIFPILIGLAAVFVFRDRLRRKELRRYGYKERTHRLHLNHDGQRTQRPKGEA